MKLRHFLSMTGLLALICCTEFDGPNSANAAIASRALPVLEVIVAANIAESRVSDVATCIGQNASPSELLSLADAAEEGINQDVVELVFDVSVRGGAISCIEDLGLVRA